ncbi:MAG: carbamoyltransferase C-terminal domain-containing protein [Nitrospira sp.]
MNLKIKYRESFRPFAPSGLCERVSDFLEMNTDSPYMLMVAPVTEKRRLPLSANRFDLWGIDLMGKNPDASCLADTYRVVQVPRPRHHMRNRF